MSTIECPICLGTGEAGKRVGDTLLPCGICLGSGSIVDDPWWINYYTTQFGTPDGVQMELELAL
jgi:hypothetical protein